MAYLDQFVAALEFCSELHLDEEDGEQYDFAAIRQYLQENQRRRHTFAGALALIRLFAKHFVGNYHGDLAHPRHEASAMFQEPWETSAPDDLIGALGLTIGSVFHQGRPVVQTSRSAVADLLRAGWSPGADLPVHVWLTLDDLTVIDLSIVPTLIKRGELAATVDPVFVWHESQPGDFVYEPVLGDNLFLERGG